MSLTVQDVLRELSARNYKLTPQRRVIVSVFLDNADRHLSAEEMYDLVREEYPDIGLATIYRTLDLLAGLGLAQRINFGDGCDRYELSQGTHQHHHLICSICGRVYEFSEDLLDELEEQISVRSGFIITDHEVKFRGICSECQKADEDEARELS